MSNAVKSLSAQLAQCVSHRSSNQTLKGSNLAAYPLFIFFNYFYFILFLFIFFFFFVIIISFFSFFIRLYSSFLWKVRIEGPGIDAFKFKDPT